MPLNEYSLNNKKILYTTDRISLEPRNQPLPFSNLLGMGGGGVRGSEVPDGLDEGAY